MTTATIVTHDDCDELIVSKFQSAYSFRLVVAWSLKGVLKYHEVINSDSLGYEAYIAAVNEFISYIKTWTEIPSDSPVLSRWIHEPIEVNISE